MLAISNSSENKFYKDSPFLFFVKRLHSHRKSLVLQGSKHGEQALELAKMGNFISIPTSVVYSSQKQELARNIPFLNMLIETDSPIMSPFKDKKRNEPSFIIAAIKKIAGLRKVSEQYIADQTTKNAITVYGLKNRF
jgi:Tat protein secretion system quality control protein TatD with DNase activity